jgi:hypothetical protein
MTSGACPECRGRPVDGLACQEMFEALLAWEWQDPALGAVHFLTVSSYLLQHPATLTADALAAIRSAFAAVVDGVMTVEQVRARHARLFAGERRARKAEGELCPQARTWSMTIADVYTGGQPGAAGRVAQWAQAIRDEMADNPA